MADAGYPEGRRGGAAPPDRSAGDHDGETRPDLVLTESGWASGPSGDARRRGSCRSSPFTAPPRTTSACGRRWCRDDQRALPHLPVAPAAVRDDLDSPRLARSRALPLFERLDREGIALAPLRLRRDAESGVTTCVDFFYLQGAGNANAEAVIEAARDIGIRLVLARDMYDWDGRAQALRETVAERRRRTRELIAAHPTTRTTGGAARAAQPARRVPGDDQGRVGDRGDGGHGFTSRGRGTLRGRAHAPRGTAPPRCAISTPRRAGPPRMIGVHCVWLDDGEIEADGRPGRGARVLPSLQHVPRRGITRVPELCGRASGWGFGTDGGCTNNRLSIFEEMRIDVAAPAAFVSSMARRSTRRPSRPRHRSGAEILGLDAGRQSRRAGSPILVAIDLDRRFAPPADRSPEVGVYAMSPRAVTDVWVTGAAWSRGPPRDGDAAGSGPGPRADTAMVDLDGGPLGLEAVRRCPPWRAGGARSGGAQGLGAVAPSSRRLARARSPSTASRPGSPTQGRRHSAWRARRPPAKPRPEPCRRRRRGARGAGRARDHGSCSRLLFARRVRSEAGRRRDDRGLPQSTGPSRRPELGSVGASGRLAPLAHVGSAARAKGRPGSLTGQLPPPRRWPRGRGPARPRDEGGLALLNGTHLMAVTARSPCSTPRA